MFRKHENGGSNPSSVTGFEQYESLASSTSLGDWDTSVQIRPARLKAVRYANRQSGPLERRTFVGSTPTLVTAEWTGE